MIVHNFPVMDTPVFDRLVADMQFAPRRFRLSDAALEAVDRVRDGVL